jgi:hypothetical protein
MPQPLFTPGKDLVPLVQEAGWDRGPVWTGAENFTPTTTQSPDHPAHSQDSASVFGICHENLSYINVILYNTSN